jgi:hypothetical protein
MEADQNADVGKARTEAIAGRGDGGNALKLKRPLQRGRQTGRQGSPTGYARFLHRFRIIQA